MPFRWYWFGGLCSDVGNWAQATVVPYLVLRLTDSPLWVGAAGAVPLLAQVLATLAGGRFANGADRMSLLLRANIAMLAVAALLAALVSVGWGGAATIVAGATVLALVFGAQHPIWQSLPVDLVPPANAGNAAHLTIAKFQVARAVGPLVGGLLLAWAGAAWALWFNALTFVVAIVTVLRIRPASPAVGTSPTTDPADERGVAAVLRNPVVALPVALTAVVALLGLPVVQLTPLLAEHVYQVGPGRYGLLLSAFGCGSVAGAFALTMWRRASTRSGLVVLGFVAFGSGLVLAGTVSQYWIGAIAVALTGASFAVATSALHAALQLLAPPSQRGRAIAWYLVALRAGGALGLLAQSWLIGVTSTGAVFAATGVVLLLAGGALSVWRHRLAPIDRPAFSGVPTGGN